MNVNERKTTGQTQQRGITLVTVALLLLLLGGALMAGVAYLRASLPADLAASQKDALLLADKAVLGFASIHHRLPCPAATPGGAEARPDGAENCNLVKGWLPARTLDLDATMFAPGLVPMRYVVYHDDTTLPGAQGTAAAYSHRSLTKSDPLSTPPSLPFDAYEPSRWEAGAVSDPTEIEDVISGNPRAGRFMNYVTGTDPDVLRYTFKARNGLDMCETMRFVRSSFGLVNPLYAHYIRGGAPVMNIAYGIAAPGLGDASDNGSRFEGANASDDQTTPALEAPDRAHGAEYNDYVFVRDLPSLMTAFGCRPVPYNFTVTSNPSLASGDMSGLTGLIADIVEFASQLLGDLPLETLPINYSRQGIAAPMQSSVQSVALAVNLVEEVESQRDGVKSSAAQTMGFGIVQSVMAGAGIVLSVATIVADGIAIAESIGIAAACIGLCVNEYVAIGFYVASIAVSAVSLVVNIAAMGTLIGGTVQAGLVMGRLGGEEEAAALMNQLCTNVAKADENIADASAELEKTKADLKAARDEAEAKLKAAETKLNGDKAVIEACRADLDAALAESPVNLEGGGVCSASGAYGDFCPALANYRDAYAGFQVAGFQADKYLYQALYEAEWALAETEKGITEADAKIAATDRNDPAVQAQIDAAVLQFPQAQRAAKKLELEARYDKEHQDAVNKRAALVTLKPGQETAVTTARTALDTAIGLLTDPASVSNATQCNSEGTVDCAGKYQALCGDAYTRIKNGTVHVDWTTYESRKTLFDSANESYQKLAAISSPTATSCAAASVDGKVIVWPSDGTGGARDVLSRVDKRSVLQ
ncbi:MAG: hypothetical protein LBL72_00775 [Candidatus Accumulibacter sp.]|jgi:hypothetical protein|nr:hypothetical protein [Accumulibacter sp.]